MEGQGSPGSGDSFAGNDTLEGLGLVDPASGRALPTSDWAPGRAAPPGPNPERDPQSDQYRQDRFDPDPWNQNQQQGQSAPSSSSWDSDDNPYKAEALRARAASDPSAQARQVLQSETQSIASQAQAAFSQLVASGMPAEQAQIVIGAAQAAAMSEAQLRADRLALLPVAKQEVANRIARQYSLPGARIEPSELANETSVEAMKARAQVLAETRRGQNFSARSARGADRVERGAAPGSRIDYESLSPFDTIRLGIARGQFS